MGRAEADFLAPFAPAGRFEGLAVEHVELFDAEDLFWSRYLVDGDADRLGAAWAGFARAAIFPTLTAGLDGGVCDPRAGVFVEQLESGVAGLLAADPASTTIPLAVVGLFAVRGAATFIAQYALTRITNDGMDLLRRDLFAQLMRADLALFGRQSASTLSNTIVAIAWRV